MSMIEFFNNLLHEHVELIGLYTSCSRFSKKLPVISQKVAEKLLRKQQKLLFVTKLAQKLLEKTKHFLSDAKICKLYNKNKISKHFCAILRRNQRC